MILAFIENPPIVANALVRRVLGAIESAAKFEEAKAVAGASLLLALSLLAPAPHFPTFDSSAFQSSQALSQGSASVQAPACGVHGLLEKIKISEILSAALAAAQKLGWQDFESLKSQR